MSATLHLPYRAELDYARAIAQIFVVIQHVTLYFFFYGIFTRADSAMTCLLNIVPLIHIPTFMLIAGILTAAGTSPRTTGEYQSFLAKKAQRLILPYTTVTILHFLLKILLPVSVLSGGYTALLYSVIAPNGGAAGHLWFLYCLFSIFVLWPLIVYPSSPKILLAILALFISIAIMPVPWPVIIQNHLKFSILGLQELFWYLPIFGIGYCYERWRTPAATHKITLPLLMFAYFVLIVWLRETFLFDSQYPAQILFRALGFCGNLVSAFGILWFCCWLTPYHSGFHKILGFLGKHTFAIYLLHVALVARPASLLVAKLQIAAEFRYGAYFLTVFLTLVISALLATLIQKNKLLSFLIVGVSSPKNSGSFCRRKPLSAPGKIRS